MRERAIRAGEAQLDDADDAAPVRPAWLGGVLEWMRQRPKDTMASALAALAATAILVNALFLQSGPHPAPIFAHKPAPTTGPVAATNTPLPRSRTEIARPRSEIMAEIQRELAKRGFYDGAVDGAYGPDTDSAIRDFEQAAGLRPSAEPNDVLLRTLQRLMIKARPAAPSRSDPIAELLAPNRRVTAVQRALSDFGYGQIKPSGVMDPETKSAIERFERERKLPVSGQISDRLTRELSAMTGRPLE